MIGSVTKNGGRREMETYDRICDQKRREKRNGFEDLPKIERRSRRSTSKTQVKCKRIRRQKEE